MYVSYSFYESMFGHVIPLEDFPRAELRAEAHIRALTYVRGDIFAVDSDTVKAAVCAAAEVIYLAEKRGGSLAGIASENNDGYSVSYLNEAGSGQTAEEVLRKKVYETVRLYLLPTGWLDRSLKGGGRCDDCDCDYHL